MTSDMQVINKQTLDKLIQEDFIKKTKHPSADLFIYNYTKKTQFENLWNRYTMMCRGLILDAEDNVIARPLDKFFNIGQYETVLPSGEFKVYEKLDGSLGILYWLEGKPFIATRGSFASEGANYANRFLVPRYTNYLNNLDQRYTYLFEIISPASKIVVNYPEERLVLLAARHTLSGLEKDIENIDYPDKAKLFDGIKDFEEIVKQPQIENEEGFVIRWSNGFRLKFKFEEYIRLHRILTNVNSKTLWKGKMHETNPKNYPYWKVEMKDLLERVPDEFYGWVKKINSDLEADYKKAESEILSLAEKYKAIESRKELVSVLKQEHPKEFKLILMALDKQDYSELIYKSIKPELSYPFIIEDEN